MIEFDFRKILGQSAEGIELEVKSKIERGSFVVDAGFVVANMVALLTLAVGLRFFHACEPLVAERL